MAYDEKYRSRVIEYKDAGHTFKEVYEAFGVNSKSYYQWKKQIEDTGGFQYNYPKSHAGKIEEEKLVELVKKHPDWYLSEFAEQFDVWPQAIHKKFKKLGITRKKKLLPTPKSLKNYERST